MSSELDGGAYAFPQLDDGPLIAGSAADLIDSAWAQAERIKDEAREAGFAEGRSAGLETAREEVSTAVTALGQAVASLAAVQQEVVAALEHDAVDLAFRLAEQVLAGTLAVQPERVVDVARNVLRRVTDRRRVVLLVNPADLEVIASGIDSLKRELGGIESCDVQSDRRIDRGGVILRTDAGEIDTTITSQLERAREIVAESLRDGIDAG